MEDKYFKLDPLLQQFHRQPVAGGQGVFQVIRRPGWTHHLLGWLMGMPTPGVDVPLRLEVAAEGQRECWRRWFAGHAMVTWQWPWCGLLIESAGPLQLGILLRMRHGGMTFRSVRAWLAGLPLPPFLSPRVTAVVLPRDGGWFVRVRIRLPLVGEMTRYEGKVVPDVCRLEPAPGARVSGSV